jgi:hypothetical protein
VFILPNGEGLETALPNMAAATIALPVAMHVAGKQPLHPVSEVVVARRPKDQVKVVGHQTITDDTHGHAGTGLADQADEALVVVLVVKDACATIAAIQSVVAIATDGSSCSARHEEILVPRPRKGKQFSGVRGRLIGDTNGKAWRAQTTLNVPIPE